LLLGELLEGKRSYPGSQKTPWWMTAAGFEVFVWRRLTLCWILNAMSPEIQEWSHKSRSRI